MTLHDAAAPAGTAQALDGYRRMARIRAFEERCLDLSRDGLIAGSIHLCLGQEAIPVGALAALTDQDRVLATYRGHGWAIACGVPLDGLLGELCQRDGGINGGRGGSPHFFAPKWGMLGENSIVGAGVPISAGVALASKLRGRDRVVVTSIGDGAMSQGAVHEALVFAAEHDLPLIVVVENNGWAEMTATASNIRIGDLADRAPGYGIEAQVVDGTDPLAVEQAVAAAADTARGGRGPVLLECKVSRLSGHYNRDIQHYRPKDDVEAAAANDPLVKLRAKLHGQGHDEAELDALDAAAKADVDAAERAVREMGEPDPATARDHLYAPAERRVEASTAASDDADDDEGEETTYVKAVTAALETELENRAEVLVYGEDVGRAGGILGASRGLQQQFGADRVFDTPIAEAAILGSAIGAAMEGFRPVVEIMWADFMLVALDQVVNQAANVRYVSRSELQAPLTIRTQQGFTPGSCAQHSQNLEAFLAHTPGLKVGLPATPQDAYDMLRAAIADDDPVVVIESRALYQTKGPVRFDGPLQPVGGARIRREGKDAVILTWGPLVPAAIDAANALNDDDIATAVVDLRWLNPLDMQTIDRIVRASEGRVLVAHEANVTGGFGAEVAARVQEHHFDYLDAPVRRVGVPDSRIPSAPALQRALIPDAEGIATAVRTLVNG
ncbi:MAG: 2-oxoisovalerate dehydrogenase component [Solirubrobacteraceae bacterium]|nr:2-oxoisovalerate dehydrogenase component [Solirubrobacteraceae bacterium]